MLHYLRKKRTSGVIANLFGDYYYSLDALIMRSNATVVAGTGIVQDSSINNNMVATVGTPYQCNFGPYVGGSSAYFNGTTDYYNLATLPSYSPGVEDFTIEAWVYIHNPTAYQFIFGSDLNNNGYMMLAINANGANTICLGRSGVSWDCTFAGHNIVSNTWAHIAISKNSDSVRCFVNGVQIGTTISNTANWTCSPNYLCIGRQFQGPATFGGFMSDFRLVKGTGLYTANFTPNVIPLTAITGTQILLKFNNASANNKVAYEHNNKYPLVATNKPTIGDFSPFASGGASAYFGDTNDFYSCYTKSNAFSFGVDDFTIEAWVYLNSGATYNPIVDTRTSATASNYVFGIWAGSRVLDFLYAGARINSVNAVPLKQWTHIAVTRLNGVINLYINGVKDTAQVTYPTAINASREVAIIGTVIDPIYFKGYISNLRLSSIARYTSTFTPSAVGLAYDANTKFMSFASNKAGIMDYSFKNNFITNGYVSSSDIKKKFSNSSMYFNGSTDFITSTESINLGKSDFTIEGWIHPVGTSYVGTPSIFDFRTSQGLYPNLYFSTGGNLVYYVGSAAIFTTVATVPLNNWSHIALCKLGNKISLYLNGLLVGSAVDNNTYLPNPVVFGKNNNNGMDYFIGYMDDWRITPGVCRYHSDFHNNPDLLWGKVASLLHFEETHGSRNIFDEKGNIVTVNGNVSISAAQAKFGSSSIYFNGGNLQMPAKSSVSGTGDFTVEFWIRPTAFASGYKMLLSNDVADGLSIILNSDGTIGYGRALVTTQGTTTNAVTFASWNHIAVSRTDSTLKIYINGTLGYSAVVSTSYVSGVVRLGVDGGGVARPYTGYMDEYRVTLGASRYSADFTPAVVKFDNSPLHTSTYVPATAENNLSGDPHYNQVSLHMHMENTHGATVLNDQKGKTVTLNNVVVSRDNKRYGNTSAYFNGTNASISVANDALFSFANDFTIEAWVNPSIVDASFKHIFSYWTPGNAGGCSFMLSFNQTHIALTYGIGGGNYNNYAPATVPVGQWSHIAAVRKNGYVSIFLNGVKLITWLIEGAFNIVPSNPLYIGYDGASAYFKGYIDEVRITTGHCRYTENFTLQTAPYPDVQDYVTDPYFSQSVSVRSIGSSGSNNNTILDKSVNNAPITKYGNVAQSPMSPYSRKGWSALFKSANVDFLNITVNANAALGVGDFTIESWVNPTSFAVQGTLLDFRGQSGISCWCDVISTSGKYLIWNQGTNSVVYTSAASLKVGKWTHIAAVRINGTLKIYINGKLDGTVAYGASLGVAANNSLTYGVSNWPGQFSSASAYNGLVSNLRIVKGTGIYTGEFTPPNQALTAVNGTVLLMFNDKRLVDQSSNNYQFTINGNPTIQQYSPFSINLYNKDIDGSSLYFDGAGDLLVANSSTNYSLGDTFTIECWINPNTLPVNNYCRMIMLGSNNSPLSLFVGYNTNGALAVSAAVGTAEYVSTPNGAVEIGKWNHFAVSVNNRICTIYKNGKQIATGTITTQTAGAPTVSVGFDSATSVNWNYQGYIADLRIVKGYALYPADFTPPTAPITTVAGTQLLLQGDNAKLIDMTGRVSIATEGAVKTTIGNKRYTQPLEFNGNIADYVALMDNQLLEYGSGDFTVEMWYYPQSTARQFLYGISLGGYWFGIDYNSVGTNKLGLWGSSNGTTWDIMHANAGGNGLCPTVIQQNQWHHIAVTRHGNTWRVYLNGAIELTLYTAGAIINQSGVPKLIGKITTSLPVVGLIEDFRSTKGVSRYNAAFIPPVAKLPLVA